MNREQATDIARRAAKEHPESYYKEPFEPHAWVIEAILAATHELARISQLRGEEVARLALELGRVKAERDHVRACACCRSLTRSDVA